MRIFDIPIRKAFEKKLVVVIELCVNHGKIMIFIYLARCMRTFEVVQRPDGTSEVCMTKAGLRDFAIEYAQTGRAKCRLCEQAIVEVILNGSLKVLG